MLGAGEAASAPSASHGLAAVVKLKKNKPPSHLKLQAVARDAGLPAGRDGGGGAGAGAKGAALALMIELLCGALTGSNFGYQGTSFFEPTGAPPSIGHMMLLFDPAAFGGADSFGDRAEELFGAVLAQDGARLPGDRRLKLREAAERDGVNIPDSLLDDIKSRAS